ncbi:YbaB/EbfC family nucleoid-associated protein [Psychroflexus sp. ALD_RP9]|jgi:DNA-binding YbaB/EbfC family protein|uniref:YbaB/EbfC family nucleoid-associated protein n=1 Tax=Psychroflexus sp. ALD_RP9 TaxID=2777186 RepID=UPI001A8DFFBD|nr:YbaB/EbfC family nucleoid-associated protein [Psychroflexus sp. ALD_RP9]QSS97464.1 YbaB/EbfC family nucleoid-associated protein [Psychroflexus sp. ALD_RP9]
MFGDMMGMMGKLKETQAKVEETKKRLDSVSISEQSNDALLKVIITANREIKTIEIDDELLKDKEQLEDYLIITLNRAIKKATEVNEAEISAVAKDGLPDIPGLTS